MGNMRKGLLLVALSALCWAITGNVGTFLFINKGMTPEQVTAIRLLFSGSIFLLIQNKQNPKEFKVLFKTPADLLRVVLFGVLGIMSMQYFFYVTINLANAPTATIIQYTGPFIVVLSLSIMNKRLPSLRTFVSLILAIVGTYLLITHGDIGNIDISRKALITGIISAVAYAYYNVSSIPLLIRYDLTLVTGIGMLVGGTVLFIATMPFKTSFIHDWQTYTALIFAIIFGTLLPFLAYLKGSKEIGAQKASILATVEPLLSTIVAVIFLSQIFYLIDYLGVLMVVGAVILLSTGEEDKKSEEILN